MSTIGPDKPEIAVIITDLDDTLWDWVGLWYACYKPFFDKIAEIRQVELARVLDSVKRVNQKHATTEYTFLLQEMDLTHCTDEAELFAIYGDAIDIFREARRNNLKLYPGVEPALKTIKQTGCLVVAYTESHEFETIYRLKKTGIEHYIDFLYSPADYPLPANLDLEKLRSRSPAHYTLARTVIRHTPPGARKPNAEILRQILRDIGAKPEETLYIGDKLQKDVLMAQHTGVLDAWAKYGVAHNRDLEYGLLKQVTHWTPQDVAIEQLTTEAEIKPTVICNETFGEFLASISMRPFTPLVGF